MLSRDALLYLVHHAFLPPQLPQKDDSDSGFGSALLNMVLEALGAYRRVVESSQLSNVDDMLSMLANVKAVHNPSIDGIVEVELRKSLARIVDHGGTLALNVRAQNAGVIISKIDSSIRFETFELAPNNEAVMSIKGRLIRHFPASATTVGVCTAADLDFQTTVAQTLSLMSEQPASGLQPKVKKARQMHDEDRDTTHPGMVCELFHGFLTGVGEFADVKGIAKNTREEVLWSNARSPWRRSPTWLLLRVSLQLGFSRLARATGEPDLYKQFVLFFMSRILQISTQSALDSDILYVMASKVSRRLSKLGHDIDPSVEENVQKIVSQTPELLSRRWRVIQDRETPVLDLSRLSSLDFKRDAEMHLPCLDEFIRNVKSRQRHSGGTDFHPVSNLVTFSPDSLPSFENFPNDEHMAIQHLHTFENWVESALSDWTERHVHDSDACGQLASLKKQYHSLATHYYSENPEAISLMVLVLLEMWVGCDKIATFSNPLLKEYQPGITEELLQNLLLPLRSQMVRLLAVENYILVRAQSLLDSTMLFVSTDNPKCFAARYYDQSGYHQRLHKTIVERAIKARAAKIRELHSIQQEYARLMQLYHQTSCDYRKRIIDHDLGLTEEYHYRNCARCGYNDRAANLSIGVFEEPLPEHQTQLKTVVFELSVPAWFAHWRYSTVLLILDVLGFEHAKRSQPRSMHWLHTDPHLGSPFFTTTRTVCSERVGLLSETKPHVGTHRRGRVVATATEGTVCVQNGLQYRYYDSSAGVFFGSFIRTEKLPWSSTYALPSDHQALQKYIFRPAQSPNGPPPNAVIADQSDCPEHMGLHEFKELASIPLACRLQWIEIATQLRQPSVDFKKPVTALVFSQCIYQSGPRQDLKNPLRQSHELLNTDEFAVVLLESLDAALERVEQNWESSQALAIFIAIARRLLSISLSTRVIDICLRYLHRCGAISLSWALLLKQKAHEADTKDCEQFLSRSVEAALICGSAFDLDREHLSMALAECTEASILLQSCLIVFEGRQSLKTIKDMQIKSLHSRHQRLLLDVFPILVAKHDALHDAVGKSWPAYRSGAEWQNCESAHHWMVTRSTTTACDDGPTVHLNLLSGELLVIGLPLDRLPSEYEQLPSYVQLFGSSTVEVMPSTVLGMQFSAKREHHGHEVHFGLNNLPDSSSKELMMQLCHKQTGATFELVPSRLLAGCFPDHFIDHFVHWYEYHTGNVQFRPNTEAWNPECIETWVLSERSEVAYSEPRRDDSEWCLMLPRHKKFLMSIKSETATQLSNIIAPLAQPCQVHCVARSCFEMLDVEIPTQRLAFSLGRGDKLLRCREFRGMIVDPDQSLGTLVGFQNKLMLKGEQYNDRTILLIEGKLPCQAVPPASVPNDCVNGDHPKVTTDRNTVARWHAFNIDNVVQQLVDNGSIQSKLYLAYLHALTSFCLPDPFTARTGTEQAIKILSSAAVKSFDQLSPENTELLSMIAGLTPKRAYYPEHERVMQTVEWRTDLGFLAQHARFYQLVASIFDHANRCKIFYPDSRVGIPSLQGLDLFLLERDCIRSSTIRVAEYGAEDYTREHDTSYKSRDHASNPTTRFRNAYHFSSLIHQGRVTFGCSPPSADCLWNFLCRASEVRGPDRGFDLSQVNYNATLLQDKGVFLARNWLALHQTLRGEDGRAINRYALMTWLSTLACSDAIDLAILEVVGLLLNSDELKALVVPDIQCFAVGQGRQVTKDDLQGYMLSHRRAIHNSPEANISIFEYETTNQFGQRKLNLFESSQHRAMNKYASLLASQWPSDCPIAPSTADLDGISPYVNVEGMMETAREVFKVRFNNLQLFAYLQNIVETANSLGSCPIKSPHQNLVRQPSTSMPTGLISIDDLFDKPAPNLRASRQPKQILPVSSKQEGTSSRLAAFVAQLANRHAGSQYETEYVEGIKASLDSLQSLEQHGTERSPPHERLNAHLYSCQSKVRQFYNAIIATLEPTLAAKAFQSPRICPTLLLERLARDGWHKLTDDWKRCMKSYGLALSSVQRAKRTVASSSSGRYSDVLAEIQNQGHRNWDPLEFPESLLLEIESNITIRDVQEDIANEMRNPRSGCNTSMQLNMGEGKSSVIVPIVAAALADRSRLVRVVVGKPQAKQMAQMLISKLGGLLNRRIYYLPISRSLRLDVAAAETVDKICRECMTNGGILLMQPEHILSFQLMGLERYALGDDRVGRALLHTQDFFDQCSRDIVDESDENFSVKFELIYTMGKQQSIDMGPDRWNCIHQILDLVVSSAFSVAEKLQSSLEIQETSTDRFPRTRILRSDAKDLLIESIAQKVCNFGLPGFPIARQSQAVRDAVLAYISKTSLAKEEIDLVEDAGPGGFWTESTQPTLFLLRGLFAGGVLEFVFARKRWRVNYGLDACRTPFTRLAVPYRAKDMPTSRSEFSHPNVVILLSSLCYYYGGLSNEHLFDCFSHLLDSDQKDVEYQAWVQNALELPSAFCQLEGINLKDRTQCIRDVFPALRFNKRVVDYFLSNIVFPKEMKEFPHKLSASGDSRVLLPLDVTYLDLPKQQHTNALVLEYLLQPENTVQLLPPATGSELSDAERLLSAVLELDPPARVILDVGAQILEMTNREVARTWLNMHDVESARGVIFFNDDEELTILDREGVEEPFQTSALAHQIDTCLVFLDEAHTRGTDLRLPQEYRAAVTLGANLTKDRLVQACMRMRKLGKGQSVVFCVTEEIRSKIQDCTSKLCDREISVSDVLQWSISETLMDARRTMPLWAVQGERFIRQEVLWHDAREGGETRLSREKAQEFLEAESHNLEARYRPKLATESTISDTLEPLYNARICEIKSRCSKFENLEYHSSSLQEEQERELSPEIQHERQVQRPPAAKPADHCIHPDIKAFISTGIVKPNSQAYMPAFASLSKIRAAAAFDVFQLGGRDGLLVSKDFARTVKQDGLSDVSDAYQRSVQWILTYAPQRSSAVQCAMVISPYEAQELYPEICSSAAVVLHIYKPRWNLGYRSLDHLNFFTVPQLSDPRKLSAPLLTHLNLFAGQLYFSSVEGYRETCKFLGLATTTAGSHCVIAADGFIVRDREGRLGANSGLSVSPVPFLKEVFRIRKNGETFSKTNIGKVLNGLLLSSSDIVPL